MDVTDQLKRLIDDALCDDPRTALIALRRFVDEELPWIEQKAVASARCAGWNWATIGRLLGRSRSSVRERFKDVRLAPRPIVETFTSVYLREYRELLTDARRWREFDSDEELIGW